VPKKKYVRETEVRRIARERVGAVPSSHIIQPKIKRKKPKHKERLTEETEA
jgi:hypothetical protein